jgi:hypothetical protein
LEKESTLSPNGVNLEDVLLVTLTTLASSPSNLVPTPKSWRIST